MVIYFAILSILLIFLVLKSHVQAQAQGIVNLGNIPSLPMQFQQRQPQQQQQQQRIPNDFYTAYAPAPFSNSGVGIGSCGTNAAITAPMAPAAVYYPQVPLQTRDLNIVEMLSKQPRFGKLVKILQLDPKLLRQFLNSGPFTIFAPTEEAISRMPLGSIEWLIANPPLLRRFIQTHIIRGITIFAEDLQNEDRFVALDGSTHHISLDQRGNLEIDLAARIFQAKKDEVASNGIVHGISNVLLPTGFALPQHLPRCKKSCLDNGRPLPLLPLCVKRCAEGYNDY